MNSSPKNQIYSRMEIRKLFKILDHLPCRPCNLFISLNADLFKKKMLSAIFFKDQFFNLPNKFKP